MNNKLKEYAHLLVDVGLNVQPGQTPRINSSVEFAPLARLCVEACYDRGARDVLVDWHDDFSTRQKYLRADKAVFSEFPGYQREKMAWMLEKRTPNLSIVGGDPELLKGVDPDRIQTWQRVSSEPTRPYFDAMTANQFQWCVGAYPTPAWAKKVFPGLGEAEALAALWEAVYAVCRITGDGGAVERWQAHIEATTRRAKILNGYDFKSLHYTNSLGTDLTVELPENHIWAGACDHTPERVRFVPNMPTEEIFTAPRRDGVNGRVYAAMPLALNGNLVEDFWLEFRDGCIVDLHAGKGEEHLRAEVDLDEGSRYLGEVALVGYDSPIRNTGLLFCNTLFDENASCHLAFGAAYPECVKGGNDMSAEEQRAAGLNQSMNHVDFMVGTKDLSIVGVTRGGQEVPVFVDGNFAF